MKSAKDILRDALAKLRRGWVQGFSAISKDGIRLEPGSTIKGARYCVAGAVSHSTDDRRYQCPQYDKAISALVKALARKTKKRANFDKLIEWNDSHRRKKKDVIELVKSATKILEGKK